MVVERPPILIQSVANSHKQFIEFHLFEILQLDFTFLIFYILFILRKHKHICILRHLSWQGTRA